MVPKLVKHPLLPSPRHAAVIFFSATAWTLGRLLTSDIVPADGYIWVPMSWDFFGSIAESDGIHRPLYGFLAYLLTKFLEISKGFGVPVDAIAEIFGAGELAFPSSAVLAWLVLNYLSLVLSGLIAFMIFRKLKFPEVDALFFAFLVCTTAESFAYANYTLIQPAGFLGIYVMGFIAVRLYLILGGTDRGRFSDTTEVFLSFFSIGVLMLGKAEYYFVGFCAFWIAILTKRLFYVALATISAFIPVAAWISSLALFGVRYENYEVSRSDYSLWEWWLDIYSTEGLLGFMHYMLVQPLTSNIGVLLLGMGTIPTVALLIMTIRSFPSRVSFLFISYSLSAAWFLKMVNFWMPRHAYEIAPLAYASLGVILGRLWRQGFPVHAQEIPQFPLAFAGSSGHLTVGRSLVVVALFVITTSNISRAGLAIW